MKGCVVIGSRADEGLLLWPIKLLQEDTAFEVDVFRMQQATLFWIAAEEATVHWQEKPPDWVLLLGDRYEVLAAAVEAHLSTIHFVTNEQALARLTALGYANVHLVGSPGIDYIKHVQWLKERPFPQPYVVVSYQAETIDGTNEIEQICQHLADLHEKHIVFILPNQDRGSADIAHTISEWAPHWTSFVYESLPHDIFLNLLAHCDEFIGNSSAILYEAPELGVPTRLVGKRQRGRVRPWGDGHASERIVAILKSFDRAQVTA